MARKSAKTSKKKANVISVDLTDVESHGRVSDGDKLASVIEVEQKESSEGNPYLNWKLKVKGGTVYHMTSLQPQALWNLRSTIEACGMEVPDGSFELDLSQFEGAELGVCIENEEYRGKQRPRVVEVFSVEDLEETEEEEPEEEIEEEEPEEEEEPKPKAKGKAKGKGKSKAKKLGKGSKVSWEDEDEEYEGKVLSVDEGIYTVEDQDGDEWELEKEDLTLI